MKTVEFYPTQFEFLETPSVATSAIISQPVVGQYFDQDLGETTGKMLSQFYESGQMWALIIGIVLGYGFKSFSSYG